MKESKIVESLLNCGRIAVVRVISIGSDRVVENKKKEPVGVIRTFECQFSDGKCPSVQVWLPREVRTLEQAAAVKSPMKVGDRLAVGYESLEFDGFALNKLRMTVGGKSEFGASAVEK